MDHPSFSSFAPLSFGHEGRRAGEATSIDLESAVNLLASSWRAGRDHIPCVTGPSRDLQNSWDVHPESFTAMVVADLLLGQPEHRATVAGMISMLEEELCSNGLFHFFKDHERLPADADCTALGLSVLLRAGAMVTERAHAALDLIAKNVNSEGVIETYFDPTGERAGIVDPVVCANVLYLAHQLGRGDEFQPTLSYLREVLVNRQFRQGTRYYHSPDTFLYFTARFVRRFHQVHGLLLTPLREALRERQCSSNHTIDLAQRVIAAQWIREDDAGEGQLLLNRQERDGCWPADSLFHYGRKKIYFGSRVLATAFALRAVRGADGDVQMQKPRRTGQGVPFALELAV